MIHICFGASVTGALKYALRKTEDRVIGFPADLSIGPIAHIDQDDGITRHFRWVRETFRSIFGDLTDDEPAFREALRRLEAIPPGTPVTIWTCENAAEQIGLRLVLHLLKDKPLPAGTVNTATAMEAFNEGRKYRIEILHSGECSPEQLISFYAAHRTSLPEDESARLREEGERLLGNQSLVRSWRDGRITDEPLTRDDARILEHAENLRPNGFLPAARLIGEVIGYADQPLSDLWVEYRIRSLIEEGRLESKGSLQSMRLYQVRAK
ncbi:DUF1835 domain-containing protein [Bhargavaea ullalensis]|uniref:DUF1835 domain-containing protein n=1 Tax=Bhargavaea ullalensis TaxID=1265685 RepID=A0ABV2G890_9BACL